MALRQSVISAWPALHEHQNKNIKMRESNNKQAAVEERASGGGGESVKNVSHRRRLHPPRTSNNGDGTW